MTISRREFLRLAGLVASSAALASCSPVYNQLAALAEGSVPDGIVSGQDLALLRRLTYGPGRFERSQVAASGLAGWLETQLAPTSIEDPGLALRLRPLDFLAQDAATLVGQEKNDLIAGLKRASLLAKVYSRRQIYEMMVEFWSDHFNITVAKGDCWFLKVVDDRQVIRTHAMGNFRDLLWASAHSPAMLVYLDNQANERSAPNENYARELMELHTLGVDGGYTQKDVMELARCLTGWTVKEHFWRGQFTFDPDRHDNGVKTVLTRKIEPAGIQEAERVLEELAVHPATARHLARKLVQRFVTDRPMKDARLLVDRVASTFLTTGGDIPAVLKTMLIDGMLANPKLLQAKYKRPVDFLASALRGLQVETNAGQGIQSYLNQMGQPFFEWPTPDGAPDTQAAWMGNLMPRWKLALRLVHNEIEGTTVAFEDLFGQAPSDEPAGVLTYLAESLLGLKLTDADRQSLLAVLLADTQPPADALKSILAAGLIASPAFQWR